MVEGDIAAVERPGEAPHISRRIVVTVATCLAIFFVAYVPLSGKAVTNVADASGARPKSAFNALWFANPSVASHPIRRSTPVRVVVANQTHRAQTVRWSASSSGATLQRGAMHLAASSTKTFVVSTRGARAGQWFSVQLDGTSIVIKAMITS